MDESKTDPIRPDYYRRGGIEVNDIIEAYELDWWRANALKYIARAGHKDPATEIGDIRKAVSYLQDKIERLKGRA